MKENAITQHSGAHDECPYLCDFFRVILRTLTHDPYKDLLRMQHSDVHLINFTKYL